jgi:hypothetical protein
LRVSRTREDWWQNVAKRHDEHLIKLLKARVPWPEFKRALREQEEELVREARTPAERLHLQRLSMPVLVTEAYARGLGWDEFGPLLRRCQRLGYADMTHQVYVACCFVQALPRFPDKRRQAFTLLDEVERRLKRIRKSHYLRREGMEGIAHARRVAEGAGIKPDAP